MLLTIGSDQRDHSSARFNRIFVAGGHRPKSASLRRPNCAGAPDLRIAETAYSGEGPGKVAQPYGRIRPGSRQHWPTSCGAQEAGDSHLTLSSVHKNVGRKILQDFANSLCHMLVGWRMGEDLELLADLPDGTLNLDVLSGTATHSVNGHVNLHIARELQAWLQHRLLKSRIEPSSIAQAAVTATVRTNRIASNRMRIVSFDFAVDSIIETADREYRGKLCEVHQWHSRMPSN